MMVLLNENGYVESYALVGKLVGGIEIQAPEDIGHFEAHYASYSYANSKIQYNETRDELLTQAKQAEEIRERRERECFSIVNRGQLWYSKLTDKQRNELQKWYDDWLNATSTKEIPNRPSWLEE